MNFQQFDDWLFLFVNKSLESEFLNTVMPIVTNLHKLEVVKFGIFPVLMAFWLYRQRGYAVKVILVVALTAGIADLVSYRGIKSLVKRPRPNQTLELGGTLRLPYGPKSPSFPSNHATNTAAMATAASYYFPQLTWVFWGLAGVVAFSRVYLGVHYPSDVIAGMLLGLIIGFLYIRYIIRPWPLLRKK